MEKIFFFQSWLDKYLRATNYNFLSYLAAKQMEGSDVDGCLVMMTAFYFGRVITIITGNGIWSSEHTVNHDIVFQHRGGNQYINSSGTGKTKTYTNTMENIFFFLLGKYFLYLKNILKTKLISFLNVLKKRFSVLVYLQLTRTGTVRMKSQVTARSFPQQTSNWMLMLKWY